jgi:hypothetical protein
LRRPRGARLTIKPFLRRCKALRPGTVAARLIDFHFGSKAPAAVDTGKQDSTAGDADSGSFSPATERNERVGTAWSTRLALLDQAGVFGRLQHRGKVQSSICFRIYRKELQSQAPSAPYEGVNRFEVMKTTAAISPLRICSSAT